MHHARLPCPSLSPRACSNHLIFCCHLILLPPIFPISGSFPVSQLFTSGGQSIGASVSASVLLKNIPGWILSGLIFWQSKGLKSLLTHQNLKSSIIWHSAFFMAQVSHLYITTGKTTALTIWIFEGKVVSLLFNMLSRFVTAFLLRSKWKY